MIQALSPTGTVRTETMGDSFFQSFSSNLGINNNNNNDDIRNNNNLAASSFQIDLESSISNLLDAPWNEDYSPRPTIRSPSSKTTPPPGMSRLDFLQDSIASIQIDTLYVDDDDDDDDNSSASAGDGDSPFSGSMDASLTLLQATSADTIPFHRTRMPMPYTASGSNGVRNNHYFSASLPHISMGNDPAPGYPNHHYHPTTTSSYFFKSNSKSLSAITENSDETILIAMLRRQIQTLKRQILDQQTQNRQAISQQAFMATIPERPESPEATTTTTVSTFENPPKHDDGEQHHSSVDVSMDDILMKLDALRGGDDHVKSQLKISLQQFQSLQHDELTNRAMMYRQELEESESRIAELELKLLHLS
jgi:hypothetical protein